MHQILISFFLIVSMIPILTHIHLHKLEGLPRSRQATMTLSMSNLNNPLASLIFQPSDFCSLQQRYQLRQLHIMEFAICLTAKISAEVCLVLQPERKERS
jgi:uncharacterized membrane protein